MDTLSGKILRRETKRRILSSHVIYLREQALYNS